MPADASHGGAPPSHRDDSLPHEAPVADERLDALAIVGMAGRFGAAPDLDAWWGDLAAGRDAVRRFSDAELAAAGVSPTRRRHPSFVPARAPLVARDPDGVVRYDADRFDPACFGMSLREAEITDPQHRLFLECSLAALEDAGLVPERFAGTIGVYGGCSPATWLAHVLTGAREEWEALGEVPAILATDKDHLTTRVAYKLGLTGPVVTVGTACSTSLVAIHLAAQALLTFQCDAALAGGSSVAIPFVDGHLHQEGGITSPDGACRPFDAASAGTVSGDGVGVVVLRRLADAVADGDPIRAVLLATAVTNDGRRKLGYSAPGVDGQREVVSAALALANVPAASIGYLQAHGTGTALGDPVELAALRAVYGDRPATGPTCALGSVKANVGHTNAAAGVASFAAAVLALEHRTLPPVAHYRAPNPALDLERSPFRVPMAAEAWESPAPRRAAVSAMGIGGTNAHAVLEEAPPAPPRAPAPEGPVALALSAMDPSACDRAAARLADWLDAHPDARLDDVATTLATRRALRPARAVWIAPSRAAASATLRGPAVAKGPAAGTPGGAARETVWLFPAQGTLRGGEARAAEGPSGDPAFRAALDEAAAACLAAGGPDPRAILDADPAPPPGSPAAARLAELLADPRPEQAASFALAWALAARWREVGPAPARLLGHSGGEYVAAAVAGLLSLADAARLVVRRAELLATVAHGALLHVVATPEEIGPHLGDDTWIALRNAPRATVVAGTPAGVEALEARLAAAGLPGRRVRATFPAHSPLVAPVAEALAREAAGLPRRSASIPVLSCVDGAPLDAARAADPAHWARHLAEPVDMAAALAVALAGDPVVVELGPPGSVRGLVALNAPGAPVVAGLPDPTPTGWAERRAAAWAAGADVDAASLLGASGGRAVRLPAYPFARVRCWIGPHPDDAAVRTAAAGSAAAPPAAGPAARPRSPAPSPRLPRPPLAAPPRPPTSPAERELLAICEDLLGVEGIGIDDDFFSLGGDSLITLRLMDEVERRVGQRLPPAAAYAGLTVARLAPYFDAPAGGAAPTPVEDPVLVPFRTTGSRPPIYFAHPLTGVVFPYFPLARALGDDQPFYGLQAAHLDGSGRHDRTVEEMGARYVEVIRRVQPRGPYHLGGYSFGALVAYDVALRLRALGEEVGLLALVDEAAPVEGLRPGITSFLRLFTGASGRNFVRHLHDYAFLARGANDGDGPRGLRGSATRFLRRSALAALVPPDTWTQTLGQPGLDRLTGLLLEHMRATYAYTPGPFDGDATVFTSEWTRAGMGPTPTAEVERLGWTHLVRGRVDVRRCDGDHLGMLRNPYADVLAREIRAAMDCRGEN